MVNDGVELLVSAFRDPDFSLMLSLGSSGAMTELIDDAIVMPAPLSEAAATEALNRLRIVRRQEGLAVGPSALADFAVRFAAAAAAAPWRRFVLEINPIKWTPALVTAVDGLVIIDVAVRGDHGQTFDRGQAGDRRSLHPLYDCAGRWGRRGVVGCFTEDGWLDSLIVGWHQCAAALRDFAEKTAWPIRLKGARFRHVVSNMRIQVEGDRAWAQCYLLDFATIDGETKLLSPGEYDCELLQDGKRMAVRQQDRADG
jgi:hypothetical protein